MPEKDSASKLAFSIDETIEDIVQNYLTKPGHKVKILSIRDVDTAHKLVLEVKDGVIEETIETITKQETKQPQKKAGRKKASNYVSLERFRDIYKEVTIEGDNGEPVPFYLGLEIQSYIDTTMFTRVHFYNAFAYYLQSLDYSNSKNKGQPILKPVFTALINLSDKEWNAPVDLLEEMDLANLSALRMPEMSGMLLIDPFTRKYMEVFDSPVGMVLDLIPLIGKPGEFYDLIKNNREVYEKIPPLQKQLLEVYTDLLEYIEKEGKGEDIMSFLTMFGAEKLVEGIEKGKILGRKEALEEAKKEALEEAKVQINERNRQSALNFLRSNIDPKTIAENLDIPLSEVLELQKEL